MIGFFTDFLLQVLSQLKSLLKAGLFAILPLTLTIIVLKFLYTTFSHWLAPLGIHSVFIVFCGLIIVGFLAQFILTEAIINPIESLIDRLPVVRALYFGIKSVTDFFNTDSASNAERKVVLVEYPTKGSYHMAFLLGSCVNDFSKLLPKDKEHKPEEYVKIFMPTTHLTIGYFFLMPRSKIIMTEMSFDEAVKTLVSGGLISPTSLHNIVD